MAHCRSLRSQSSLNSFLFILTASNKTRPISNLCCIDMRLHPSLDGKLPYGRRFVHVPRKNRLHLCGDDANWAATWNRYKTHADFQLDLSLFFLARRNIRHQILVSFSCLHANRKRHMVHEKFHLAISRFEFYLFFYFFKADPIPRFLRFERRLGKIRKRYRKTTTA